MSSAWLAARRIAREEWRYWRRSRLVLAASLVVLLVTTASLLVTTGRIAEERAQREALQHAAESAFKAQPARHPHRMVHYGHYVLRTPAPLAAVDPGVDDYAGTVMFLEGHRRNSAVFSPFYSAAQISDLAALTPARAYQLLAPLVLIIAGFTCLARERAARTDRLLLMSAVAPSGIAFGKALAMTQLSGVLLAPLILAALVLCYTGASAAASAGLVLSYALYLLVWSGLIVVISGRARSAATALLALVAAWFVLTIVVPGVALRTAQVLAPVDGKIRSDLAASAALRDAGDGHNAEDPAFARLRTNLLTQYGVTSVEELPINFRGVVAKYSEARQAEIMDSYSEAHMSASLGQAQVARQFGWLSPMLALRSASMLLAGTDLTQLHRFERDAEATRLAFVQALNDLQINDLAYADDMARSRDPAAEQRTRVSADNWQRLRRFAVAPPEVATRVGTAAPYAAMLLAWLVAITLAIGRAGRYLGVDRV